MRRLLTKHAKGLDIEDEVCSSPLNGKLKISHVEKGIEPPFKLSGLEFQSVLYQHHLYSGDYSS